MQKISSSSNYNLFIAHTKFQSYVATVMIEHLSEFSGALNILVCPKERCYERLDAWSNVNHPELALFQKPNYIGVGSHAGLVRSFIDAMLGYSHARLYVANLWSPMNRLAYSLALLRSNISVAIYPEGLANLLVPKVHGIAAIKEWMKSIALKAQGIPYKYTSNISGEYDADIVYTFAPKWMVEMGVDQMKLKRAYLEDLTTGEDFDAGKCLLIGQGCDPMFSADEIRKSSRLVNSLIDGAGCREVYCKAHPISRSVDEAIKPSSAVRMVEDDRLVEEIIPELNCGLVISSYSSALFNLKLMYGERIRCVSVMGDVPLMRHYMYGKEKAERYRSVCREFGVELLS